MAFSTYSVVVAARHVAAKIGAVREPPLQCSGANGSALLRGHRSTEPVPSEVEGLTTPGRKRLATPCAVSLSKGSFPRKRESTAQSSTSFQCHSREACPQASGELESGNHHWRRPYQSNRRAKGQATPTLCPRKLALRKLDHYRVLGVDDVSHPNPPHLRQKLKRLPSIEPVIAFQPENHLRLCDPHRVDQRPGVSAVIM